MKIKIVSDGTIGGTKITDEETGSLVGRVTKIVWEAEIGQIPKCTLEMFGLPIDIKAQIEKISCNFPTTGFTEPIEKDPFVLEALRIKKEYEEGKK